jgi:hypothetical protein
MNNDVKKERNRNTKRKRREKFPERCWAIRRLSSHRKKYQVFVTVDELEHLAMTIKKCPFCGISLNYLVLGGLSREGPTLDRLNNEKFLTIDNIQILCYNCNTAKLKRTFKEFVLFCK